MSKFKDTEREIPKMSPKRISYETIKKILEREYGCYEKEKGTFVCTQTEMDVYINEDKIWIESYDIEEEILSPGAMWQHEVEPEDEEMKDMVREFLGKERYEKLIKEAKKEFKKAKREGWIGTEEDFIMDKVREIFSEIVEKDFDKEVREWKSKPKETFAIEGIRIEKEPSVIEKWCALQIPHYHYYKGYLITIPRKRLTKEALTKIIDKALVI